MLTTLLLVVIGVGVVFWQPDLDRSYIEGKYANTDSRYFITSDGNRLHYRDQGNKGRPALVLIHGTSSSLHTWQPLVESLETKFRLISFDLPGHGLTGEFKSRDYSDTVMVSTMIELLDALNVEKATLVGNSLGGRVALKAALAKPDLVNALILLAPGGAKRQSKAPSNIGFKILKSSIGQKLMQKIAPRFLVKRSLEQTIFDKSLVSDALTDRYWELLLNQGNRRAIVDLAKSNKHTHIMDKLTNINVASLIIWGKSDNILPVDMIRQFESQLNVSQSVLYDEIGHLPQFEAVDTLTEQVISFCSDHKC